MPCDERYRSWAMQQVPSAQRELHRAVLVGVSGCPARPGLRELHFDVAGTPWSWCFPAATNPDGRAADPPAGTLVLRPGPHGLVAEAGAEQAGGSSRPARLDLGRAADMAISGAAVFVHHVLPGRTSTTEDPGGQPAVTVTAPKLPGGGR